MTAQLSALAVAVVLGGAFGAGALCLSALVPRWAAPGLEQRIGPYIRDVADTAGVPTIPHGAGWMSGLLAAGGERIGRILGGGDVLARRLTQAGRSGGVRAFRARQLAVGVGGLMLGAVVAVVLALAGHGTPLLVIVPPLGAVAGMVLCDVQLQLAARRRLARLQEELPVVLEFLSMCLAAGEGIRDSLVRVSSVGAGELAGELRVAVLEVGTGSSLAEALTGLARRIDLAALTRGVDQLVAALERGAPLARVLQAQADDAREDAKRALIERAGRNEISMLVPLVFLVLPLSVIFAVFPGVFMLQLGLG